MNHIAEFQSAILSAGIQPPEHIEADGKLHRFSANGKRDNDAGWYVLHMDGVPAGSFGCWSGPETQTWRGNLGRKFTPQEEKAHREKIEAQRKAKEVADRQRHEQAQIQANEIWKRCIPVESHAYLTTKGINPNGARLYRGPIAINGLRCDGCLVIPLRDTEGAIWTLEFISPTGEKRFLPGGAKRGHYYAIGTPTEKIIICEGYATGASLHEVTGQAVAVAIDAGNLLPVARALRAKYPDTALLIAADNDQWTEGNPGTTKGQEAAQAVNAGLVAPQFKDTESKPTDFNDLHKLEGLEAVRQQIDSSPNAPANELTELTEGYESQEKGLLSVLSVPTPPHSGGWATPELLPELPAISSINLDALPAVLKAYVHDVAERMQCPIDFPAVTCLAMAGAAVGRKVGIRPKRADDWTVIPNQWAMIVGKSGIMKSPAISDAIAPLRKMQAEAFKTFEQDIEAYEVDAKVAKFKLDDAEKQARGMVKEGNTIGAANTIAGAQNDVKDAPTVKRYIVNDSTVEALAETLEENPNGVAVDRDELSGWLRSLDKEGQQEARAFYLTAADGDKGFTTDRIGRGRGRNIPAVCVSIIGGIQPGVLARYVRETQRGGSGDDGLLQRFGMMIYPDISGKWQNVDRMPDREARHAIDELIARLCSLDPVAIGAELDPYKPIPFLRFDHAAQSLFDEWREELENRIRQDDEHPAIISHLSKYRKLVPSLALINHLCEGGAGPVTEQALARALVMAEYLETHARRIYSYASRPDIDGAKTILSKLRGGKLKPVFNARDVYRAGWSGLSEAEEAGAALRLLVDYGYLRETLNTDTGGRNSRIFEAHPSLTGGV